MNIKTIVTITICMLTLFIHAQPKIDNQAETIQFSSPFTDTTELKYEVKKLIFKGETDTISYQLHLKCTKVVEDVATISILYSNLKNGNELYEIFEDIEVEMNYNLTNKSYEIRDGESISSKLVEKMNEDKRITDIDAEAKRIAKVIGAYKKNPVVGLYLDDLKPLFSFYNKKYPMNRFTIDSTQVEKPFPASTQVTKRGVFEQNEYYNYKYSKEVLDDGLKSQIKKDTEEALKKQMAVDSLQGVEYTIEESDAQMSLRIEQDLLVDEKGIIRRSVATDYFMFMDETLKNTYRSVELIEQE